MIRRPPRSTQSRSSAASDVYKRQLETKLLVIRFLVLFRQMVGNTLMAVDTGLASGFRLHMPFIRRRLLKLRAHGIKIVAVAAFDRTRVLHPGPFVRGQFPVSYTHLRAHE